MPKPSRKLKPQSSRASSQPPPPRAASFNPSIPSTPISGNMPSSQVSKKRSLEEDNERVFETPPRANKRLAISSEGQRTPTRSIQLSEASSPHTPFDISSGESSDSDCKIQKVQPSPSPKRKLVAASPRARPAKKAKVENQPATQQGFASIKASALATATASSKPKKTVARRRQTAFVPPHPALSSLTSSTTADLSHSSSVPPKRTPTKETQQKQNTPRESVAPQSGDESDCFIEKVLPSPKRRQQLIQQKANVKRRRVGDSVDTPVFLDAEYADENNDSDCQVVKVQPSPVQSLQIDLTQESSSDSSDFSEDETITSAQPVPPTPVEDSSDTQKQPQPSSEGDHDDNLDLLISYCDNYEANINKRTLPSSDESSVSPDCDLTFLTAPECPYDDSSAREIKQESHSDSVLKSIKQESSLRQVSSCEEDSDEEHDEDLKFIKLESTPTSRKLFAVRRDEPSGDDSEEEYQGPDLGEDEIHHDTDEDKAESTTSTPISYNSSPTGIEGFTSSPPVSYQLPLEIVSPKVATPLLGDNDSTMSMKDMPGSMKTHPARSVYNPEKRLSSLAYELQPVYSGEKLLLSHTPGTPSPFRPHHRDALIGLKGILKRSVGQRGHDSDNETVYSPFPDISPLSGDEYLVSSPSERNEPGTKNTSYERLSPLAGTPNKTLTLSDLRSKNWVSPPPKSINRPATPLPKGSKWLQQKKDMTRLAVIADDTAATDAASDQGTPSKVRSKRPVRTTRKPIKTEEQSTTDLEESEDEIQKRLEEQQLKPVVNSNWTKPPNKEMKPQVIRDGVSEHAIKPTVALFKKKVATGEVLIHKNDSSNQKYCWDVDWSVPASLTEREAHAVAAELERRGIKTDTQYSNFWYNLTMKCSKLVGSPVPLFTAKKKALDIFVKEAMRNHEFKKGADHRKAMKAQKKKLKREKKNRLLQGVEAFLIPGDTDNESESEDSDSDGEDLIAKMHADAVKHQKLSTGGTSCGRRRNSEAIDIR
ncbi:Ff.00g034280.m01.CDS01 [Fusarium sp. VM40]|nr:Ff.00g034280.m01.CDS01 [Fusarium sp. VM40]